MKNDQPLAPSSNYLVTDDGSLIIQARSVSDSGNFTCVARNAAAKRRSHTASVKVGGRNLKLSAFNREMIHKKECIMLHKRKIRIHQKNE